MQKKARDRVSEVTLDMANTMDKAIKGSFPKASIVTDRFHVQQVVTEAVQEIRIALRKKQSGKKTKQY